MDKGYSGLNPYKNSGNNANLTTPPKSGVAAMRAYDNVLTIKAEDIISDQTENAIKGHPFAHPKNSPIRVPSDAAVKKKNKNGYEQVKYTWKKGQYEYESRWHEATPNSPSKKQSWVVTRTKKGVGYGENAHPRQRWVLVGKRWVKWNTWQEAIKAKRSGVATKSQLKLLNEGHFTRKRGK